MIRVLEWSDRHVQVQVPWVAESNGLMNKDTPESALSSRNYMII
jgi:hypothetical protein